MKIVSSSEMSELEMLAYRDGASESEFMEEAGSGVAIIAHDYAENHGLDRKVFLLCGKGNNAGDAYIAGIQLLHLDYEVYAIQIDPIESCKPLCKQNYQQFMQEGGRTLENIPEDASNGMIIDGIFGTGFKGIPSPSHAAVILAANRSRLPIIAVDIPSGLDGETGETPGAAIIATETAFLSLPKIGYFLHEGWNCVGTLRYVDFGLPKKYIDEFRTDWIMLSNDMFTLPQIKRNRHKYEAGYVVGLSGSKEMPGAAILASMAALRGGSGIVRLLFPETAQFEMAASPYEIIRTPCDWNDVDPIIEHLNKASATFIGPGLGRKEEQVRLLHKVLPALQKPCVIDADALTMISEHNFPIPKNAVLTPHIGEMMRLLKLKEHPSITKDFLIACRLFSKKNNCTLVLKGGPSFIFHPDSPICVNPTGDPGMATAGSGDVLTGLIAALLAQGMNTMDAACLGVFLHGIAGENAAMELTSYGVVASDIIYHFPEAFRFQHFD